MHQVVWWPGFRAAFRSPEIYVSFIYGKNVREHTVHLIYRPNTREIYNFTLEHSGLIKRYGHVIYLVA